MREKTKQIITTIVGALFTAVGTGLAAFDVPWTPAYIAIGGSVNELINIVLQQFVRKE